MAETPAEWLPILAKRLDDRLPTVRLLCRYVDGDAPLPEMGANVRASWQKFQREARTNWGLLVQEAVADRIVPNGITVAGSTDSPNAKQAQRIWRDNRMDSVFKDWVRYGLTYAQSFLTCWVGDDEKAVITADSPETMVVSTDPLQPWRVRAALRVWRDLDAEKDYVIVWCDGYRQKFSRECYINVANTQRRRLIRLISGTWDPEEEPVETGTAPPVVVYNNPGGYGEFEPHLDVINRINRGVLQRLVITAMQAFKQRALKAQAGTAGLPTKDPEGNDIDWAKVFEPAPGALWELPPGIEVWEAQATDIRPLLDGSNSDIKQLASSTRTPLPMLMPDNQSAQGAASMDSGHLAKCEDRCNEAKCGAAAILVKALQIENVTLSEDDTVEVTFEPVAIVSLAEKFAAAAQAKAAGLPVKAIMTHVLGWSPHQVTQAEDDIADETPDPPPIMPPVVPVQPELPLEPPEEEPTP